MEHTGKTKIAIAVACLAATISVIVVTIYRKPRKNKQQLTDSSSCYLKTKQKPQHSFKRVLADNSYSQFKHLNLSTSQTNGGTIYVYNII